MSKIKLLLSEYEFFRKHNNDMVCLFNTEICDCGEEIAGVNSINISYGSQENAINTCLAFGLKERKEPTNECVITDDGRYFCNYCCPK